MGGFGCLSDAGVNWSDMDVLSDAGVNWKDLSVLSEWGELAGCGCDE